MTPEENRLRIGRDRAEKGNIDYGGGGGPTSRSLGQRIDRRARRREASGRKTHLHYGMYATGAGAAGPTERQEDANSRIVGTRRATPGIRAEKVA